ncbi:MAG: hypothetical protein ACK5JT_20115, partial [Hyphomicrobiaceae bacterium]
ALGKAIATLMGDGALRARMGEAAKARANRTFTMEICVSRYETAYRALLSGRKLGDIDLD